MKSRSSATVGRIARTRPRWPMSRASIRFFKLPLQRISPFSTALATAAAPASTGAANTVSVPADSPNATAVGGSSLTTGPGNFTRARPGGMVSTARRQTGQGGFGTSKFFVEPPYQSGSPAMRSMPDVVFNADPAAEGVTICQATGGGCPTDSLYGGTSDSTPIWAAITATLNQAAGP